MSRLKGLRAHRRSAVGAQSSESRMEEEFQFHVEMETKRLVFLPFVLGVVSNMITGSTTVGVIRF